ncbi:MAG TPA: phenylacetate--CoA ligase family protein [Verrucomicrobiae bacterium]|nr:phenylacetate--CoA ligase family protein [Verrucomicrobiae bacterium]
MNLRKPVYLSYAAARGYRFPALLSQYRREYARGLDGEITTVGLVQLLRHCRTSVEYYKELLAEAGDIGHDDPRDYLRRLPVLTKETIRANFDKLRCRALRTGKWSYNTSGGSTGEPIIIVQDSEYEDRSKAIGLLLQGLLGCDVGEPLVRLWGSERDIEGSTRSPKARFFNWLTNTTWMNAFRMSPEQMRRFVGILNRERPRLIVAYAQAAYELARFVEREQLVLAPQNAVVTSAGTLYGFMRQKIAQVFGCQVYNLYGSREVSDMACELPGTDGLWVAPWSHYIEILDDEAKPVPAGAEGNIVVTCLTNYAMPLIRYWIGDRGALRPEVKPGRTTPQFLKHVSGRNVDVFRTRDQTLIDGEYFTHLLYFRPWVWGFQVIQRSYDRVSFRVVRRNGEPPQGELEEIAAKARLVMGPDCQVDFEFPAELPPHPSGKYRYTISQVGS